MALIFSKSYLESLKTDFHHVLLKKIKYSLILLIKLFFWSLSRYPFQVRYHLLAKTIMTKKAHKIAFGSWGLQSSCFYGLFIAIGARVFPWQLRA